MRNTKFHKTMQNTYSQIIAQINTDTSSKTGDLRLETHMDSGEHFPLSFSQKDEDRARTKTG
jgi:hypothetical protein